MPVWTLSAHSGTMILATAHSCMLASEWRNLTNNALSSLHELFSRFLHGLAYLNNYLCILQFNCTGTDSLPKGEFFGSQPSLLSNNLARHKYCDTSVPDGQWGLQFIVFTPQSYSGSIHNRVQWFWHFLEIQYVNVNICKYWSVSILFDLLSFKKRSTAPYKSWK
jgi:hypothetical protein